MYDYLRITIIFVVVVMCIVGYGTFRCSRADFVDPITKSLLEPPFDAYTDGWAFLHFACYGIITYFFPDKYLYIAFMGVLWEVIEIAFKDHPFYFSDCKYQLTTDKATGWWYGRYEDIIMNTLGMAVGYYFAKRA